MNKYRYMNRSMWRRCRTRVFICPGLLLVALLVMDPAIVISQTCQTSTIVATTPTSDFVDHGDGTVTHGKTGLMWKRCSEGTLWNGTSCTGAATQYSWFDALRHVGDVNRFGGYAGHADWRMPDVKELNSIMEEQCNYPAANLEVFPSTWGWYWSSSPYVADVTKAWATNFYNVGFIEVRPKFLLEGVRLVRGQ